MCVSSIRLPPPTSSRMPSPFVHTNTHTPVSEGKQVLQQATARAPQAPSVPAPLGATLVPSDHQACETSSPSLHAFVSFPLSSVLWCSRLALRSLSFLFVFQLYLILAPSTYTVRPVTVTMSSPYEHDEMLEVEPIAEDASVKSMEDVQKATDGLVMVESETSLSDAPRAPLSCGARFCNIISHGGTIANVYTLASATLGAGIVSVPSGFQSSGIVVSTVLLLVVYLCTVYSIRLLALAKDQTGLRSYEEMARGLLGRGWDYFTAALMFLFCWGTCVGYVISVQDLLTPILADPTQDGFLQSQTCLRLLTSGVWLLGMLTLSLPKEINSLRYASTVGVTMIIFFVICMVVHSFQNGLKNGVNPDLKLVNSGMHGVDGLSLFIFAFICQVNVFEIYNEMSRPSPGRLTRDSFISMGLVALLNWMSGFFGYCDFGDEGVQSSILLMYKPREEIIFAIAYIGVCIKLCVGFAICMQPSRDAVYYCLRMGKTSDVKDWFNWLVSGFLCVNQ
eukprot:gene1538-923_t